MLSVLISLTGIRETGLLKYAGSVTAAVAAFSFLVSALHPNFPHRGFRFLRGLKSSSVSREIIYLAFFIIMSLLSSVFYNTFAFYIFVTMAALSGFAGILIIVDNISLVWTSGIFSGYVLSVFASLFLEKNLFYVTSLPRTIPGHMIHGGKTRSFFY